MARRGSAWAKQKLAQLFDYAQIAKTIRLSSVALEEKLRIQTQTIEAMQANMAKMEAAIRRLILSDAFPVGARKNIELLDAMPGIGFISAVTLFAEMGDFSKFQSAKAFAAFFGVDPTVKESGKFKGDRNQMSKRGSKLGRRVLYTIAMASVRKTKKGDAINTVLKAYYESKIAAKKKKVALVAVMHKLLHYIFAVLRDQMPFEVRKPEDHRLNYMQIFTCHKPLFGFFQWLALLYPFPTPKFL